MPPLERLFALELEYHRRARATALGSAEMAAVHTSFALQSGYESLLRSVGSVTRRDLERLAERYTLAGDVRDVLKARDSLTDLLDLHPVTDR